MQFHLAEGLSAAEAARAAIAEALAPPPADVAAGGSEVTDSTDLRELSIAWQRALDDFDEPAAQAVLDRLLSDFSVATTLRHVVLPYLHELGERWQRG